MSHSVFILAKGIAENIHHGYDTGVDLSDMANLSELVLLKEPWRMVVDREEHSRLH